MIRVNHERGNWIAQSTLLGVLIQYMWSLIQLYESMHRDPPEGCP